MATVSSNRIFAGDAAAGWQPWRPGALASEGASKRSSESPEAMQRRAHAKGFETGQRAGYAAGLAAGRAHAEAEAAQVRAVAQAAKATLQTLGDTLAEKTVRLAAAIARQILQREIDAHPEQLTEIVRSALQLLPDATARVRILVNSADVECIRRFVGEGANLPDATIVGTDDIVRGGCKIQSANGDVDATLATRMQRVLDTLGVDGDASNGN